MCFTLPEIKTEKGTRMGVSLLCLVLVCCGVVSGVEEEEHGSCSKRCTHQQNETGLPFPCSCSSSCDLYRDCCYDSPPHRNSDNKKHESIRTMCLSLSGSGHYRAVSGCPKEWSLSPIFCSKSIGHLPPVTSRTTGTTYANVYCAICNGEESHLQTWNVELQCCPEHEGVDDRRFVHEKGQLWSVVSRGGNRCLCRYRAHDNNFSHLHNLELRRCDARQEISKCSSHSHTFQQEQQQCSSFLDPVHVGGNVYRNRYCAKCNFQRVGDAKCMPEVVETMLLLGLSVEEIHRFCVEARISDCLYYLDSYGRGIAKPFSNIFNTNEESCMPPKNRRCCKGKTYDFRTKHCRNRRARRR